MAYNEELCNERHKQIDTKLGKIETIVTATHNKLFVDNGVESWQSRMNRMDKWIKGVVVFAFAIGVPVLLSVINRVIKYLAK